MDPDSKRLCVAVTDGDGRQIRDGGLARWLAAVAPARARGEVAIALAADARVRALNRRYRRQDRATDVLSFPRHRPVHSARREPPGGPSLSRAGIRVPARQGHPSDRFLGDIVIATGVARRPAREAGHSYAAELRVLALHGLLHLLGYDHHEEEDRERMRRLETRLRRDGGLSTSLIERAHGRASSRRPRGPRRQRQP